MEFPAANCRQTVPASCHSLMPSFSGDWSFDNWTQHLKQDRIVFITAGSTSSTLLSKSSCSSPLEPVTKKCKILRINRIVSLSESQHDHKWFIIMLFGDTSLQLKEKQGWNFLPTLKHSYNLELPLYQAYNAFIISSTHLFGMHFYNYIIEMANPNVLLCASVYNSCHWSG